MLAKFKGFIYFSAFLLSLLTLEFGIHILQFYQVGASSSNIALIVLATLLAGIGLIIAFAVSKKQEISEENIFHRLAKSSVILLATTTIIVFLYSYIGTYNLNVVFNLIKDFGLYFFLFLVWVITNSFYITYLEANKIKISKNVIFGVPAVLEVITILIFLFALSFDINHLASFTGNQQNLLSLHVYVRMLLIITVIVFSFFFTIKKLLEIYK